MKNSISDFSIGEMAEYFGVSEDTLRIYERKGIITPSRNEDNNYRMYNREDFIILDYIFRLRKIGLSLDEIRALIGEGSIEDNLKCMEYQREQIERKIAEYSDMLKISEDYIRGYKSTIDGLSKIEVGFSKPLIIKYVENSMVDAMNSFSELTDWFVPRFTFVIPQELISFNPNIDELEDFCCIKKQFRYAITMVDDDGLSKNIYSKGDAFKIIPSRKCVRASIRTITNNDYSEFYKCLNYIKENGL